MAKKRMVSTGRSAELPLIHLPLCACDPRLQQLLAKGIQGPAYRHADDAPNVDPASKAVPIIMQYMHASDAVQPSPNVPSLLICPPECYLQQLCVSERVRILPLFQICMAVASELKYSMRVIIVCVHQHAKWRSVLPVFQLVPLGDSGAVPMVLPVRTVVHSPHVDVIVGRKEDVTFQTLSAMVDALLTVFTVLALLGWSDTGHHVTAVCCSEWDGVHLLMSEVVAERGCSGPRLVLRDEEQDVTVVHRTGHHLELVVVTLSQIVLQIQCGDCGSSFALFRPHTRCVRCGTDVLGCLRREQSVVMRLRPTVRDLR